MTYYQLRAFRFDGSEYLVEVYDDKEEAVHYFSHLCKNPVIKSAALIYFDGDFCKTIAKFDLDGLNPDDKAF